jgi:hypothetical protein
MALFYLCNSSFHLSINWEFSQMSNEKLSISQRVFNHLKHTNKWTSAADLTKISDSKPPITAALTYWYRKGKLERAPCKEVGATSAPGIMYAYRYKRTVNEELEESNADVRSQPQALDETRPSTPTPPTIAPTPPTTPPPATSALQSQLAGFIADYLIQTLELSVVLMREKLGTKLQFNELPTNDHALVNSELSASIEKSAQIAKPRIPRILIVGFRKRVEQQLIDPYRGIVDLRFWSPSEESDKLLSDKLHSAALDGVIIVPGSGLGHKHSDIIKSTAKIRGYSVAVNMNGTSGIRTTIDDMYNSLKHERS